MSHNFKDNIIRHKNLITRVDREKKNGYKSIAVWFTGLSGSGKSSIANFLETLLFKKDINTYILDGDNIRLGLCSNLSFTLVDRKENIRRIGEVVKIMLDAGIITLIAVISPLRYQRNMIFNMLEKKNILEVFVNTPIDICEQRDPKNLYKKARLGEISNFTGIQSEYENPINPDLILDGTDSLEKNSKKIIKILYELNIIPFMK